MDFVNDVIAWKRDGNELDDDAHARLRATASSSGAVPSYQASALLMAIVLRGLSDARDASRWRAPWSTAARRST